MRFWTKVLLGLLLAVLVLAAFLMIREYFFRHYGYTYDVWESQQQPKVRDQAANETNEKDYKKQPEASGIPEKKKRGETSKPEPAEIIDYWSGPLPDFYPKGDTGQFIQHTAFALSYYESHELAIWVGYELNTERLKAVAKRSDSFREDPKVPTRSAHPRDYTRTGYDRGHLAPAADMAFSEQVMRESFYMSNMAPQLPAFNRGVWKRLEEQVRSWAAEQGSIYVITGGVLSDSLGVIGDNQVVVPKYFFKAIFDHSEPEVKAVGFLLKNEGSKAPLSSFMITIDSLEKFTGLDFFAELPDGPEALLESELKPELWFRALQ